MNVRYDAISSKYRPSNEFERSSKDANLLECISNYSAKGICWMNGSMKLTDEEKLEMIEDARNISRSKVFQAARITTQKGSLRVLSI